MIQTATLIDLLGKVAEDPSVRSALVELGLPERLPPIKDGVSANVEVPSIVVFFRTAELLRSHEELKHLPPKTAIVSEILFRADGYNRNPGFTGELPYGLAFTDARLAVKDRLGPPAWTSPLGLPSDRWELGQRYVTISFRENEQGMKNACFGLLWGF